MAKLTEEYIEAYLNSPLTEREKKKLSHCTAKHKEMYIMKRYVHSYQVARELNHEPKSKKECWQKLNVHLESHGYEPKKSIGTVYRLWDEPFHSYDIVDYFEAW